METIRGSRFYALLPTSFLLWTGLKCRGICNKKIFLFWILVSMQACRRRPECPTLQGTVADRAPLSGCPFALRQSCFLQELTSFVSLSMIMGWNRLP